MTYTTEPDPNLTELTQTIDLLTTTRERPYFVAMVADELSEDHQRGEAAAILTDRWQEYAEVGDDLLEQEAKLGLTLTVDPDDLVDVTDSFPKDKYRGYRLYAEMGEL